MSFSTRDFSYLTFEEGMTWRDWCESEYYDDSALRLKSADESGVGVETWYQVAG